MTGSAHDIAALKRFARTTVTLGASLRADHIDTPMIEMYWRALKDVPIELLEEAAVELAATAKFFPKPAEWRQAVDELLDRRERLREIAGPNGQPLLPGEIGEYHCEDCDNSGWVTEVKVCEGNCGSHLVAKAGHTHAFASPCTNKFCLAARQQKTQRKRRYAKTRGE